MAKALRVLVVEDSEDDTVLLLRHLRQAGFDVLHQRVSTRDELNSALADKHWDVVITDHNMPNFDSSAALEIIKAADKDIPVIIVSGSIGEDVAVQAMKMGANDYIMKNNLLRLIPAIERELRETENRRAHRQAEETIRHMAYHDSLTGLHNRYEFEDTLTTHLTKAGNDWQSTSLLYIDLDQFKIVNDTCGHIAGDELLRQIAVILRRCIRESDSLARLGGDEFAVLLRSCPLPRAQEIAQHILSSIQSYRFSWEKRNFVVGVSIGIVEIHPHWHNMSEVMSAADIACYAAKDRGRNRYHVYQEDDAELQRRYGEMEWVARINSALDEDRFVLYKQSIIKLADGAQPDYCEFLLRIRSSTGNLTEPGVFIPAAERYNLISALDKRVIDMVFASASKRSSCTSANTEDFLAFVNISGSSIGDDSLTPYINKKLIEYRINPANICFEITETAAISNLREALGFVEHIRQLGCRFALDDFGSGMSSFSYLKTIPADFIKIDGEFVRNMLKDPMNTAIVESINRIGHVAGLQTIGEHAESKEIIARLRAMGVDYAQGYAIDKPIPVVSCNQAISTS